MALLEKLAVAEPISGNLEEAIDYYQMLSGLEKAQIFIKASIIYANRQVDLNQTVNTNKGINNEVSDAMDYKRGVRKGCPASSMLFYIYINDIFNGMAGVSVPVLNDKISGLLFDDHAVILVEPADELQKLFDT
ncbi:hypothetical protein BB561_003862 [Smittium simulii]|uniref:Reverse transcriptase domain-containing protein n=1 Tax=Smittium simulii TaxID=133385 RepID=A0A2T9YJ88_9FUNG|nr:hypothetical protein BB561_003862 [Smittium simulii]